MAAMVKIDKGHLTRLEIPITEATLAWLILLFQAMYLGITCYNDHFGNCCPTNTSCKELTKQPSNSYDTFMTGRC